MILFVPLYYKFYSSLVELFLLRTASIVENNMNTLPHKEMPSMEMSAGALLIFNKSALGQCRVEEERRNCSWRHINCGQLLNRFAVGSLKMYVNWSISVSSPVHAPNHPPLSSVGQLNVVNLLLLLLLLFHCTYDCH